MRKICIYAAVLLCVMASAVARAQQKPTVLQHAPFEVSLRYSAQISNGPTGTCGCFSLQGGAGDLSWHLTHGFSVVGDVGVEHTGSVSGMAYGLTLTTFLGGLRYTKTIGPTHVFAQAMLGGVMGTGSQFPVNGSLTPSANSFAYSLGAGADYPLKIKKGLSLRVLQVDYIHTSLPNNSNNWQRNLRMGAGINFRFGR
jgi:outer membrane immunogenic protein